MTTPELIESKARELMKVYWNCSEDELKSANGPYAIALARHVLLGELRARIEERNDVDICLKESIDLDNGERIQELTKQIGELEKC